MVSYLFICDLLILPLQLSHLLLEDVIGPCLGIKGRNLALQLVDDEVFLRALLSRLVELLHG